VERLIEELAWIEFRVVAFAKMFCVLKDGKQYGVYIQQNVLALFFGSFLSVDRDGANKRACIGASQSEQPSIHRRICPRNKPNHCACVRCGYHQTACAWSEVAIYWDYEHS
jgi:hypothetical protein